MRFHALARPGLHLESHKMSNANGVADELADRLIAARRARVRLSRMEADALGRSLDEAGSYAVQARVCEAFGPARAFKTGRKSASAPVICAPILDGALRPSGSVFRSSEFASCGIELEIGFRIELPLPPFDAPDFEAAVRASVTAVPVIEVVDGRIEGFETMSDLLKLADNQINAGLVWAEPITAEDPDLAEPEVDLRLNGVSVVSGRQRVPGGDAFSVFLAFANVIGEHCGGLQPGQIVTTGSLTGLIYVQPGTHVEGQIRGLGKVETRYD
ncbi:fumarylacetoacetate hydrolase family protein [Terrihabitans rhizophilus]|uniref:Fumarylacetoacetase-like C-terminal domain-containing protein n=1 Tax=Terrihabitans rhizophilus TaxID=3092662 RepID=A0ABU4RIY0_9HYPH|nr:fumarylacetoacetate hydrolase family protein [Terrihabitans sp. PJ23]MDX6804777.1 hypothetical protein [Terrihabitans sp. PJ23]